MERTSEKVWNAQFDVPENKWFYKLYLIFGTAFLLLCGAAITACFAEFHIRIVIPAVLGAIGLLMLLFIGTVKKGVLSIFDSCRKLLDQAISGQAPPLEDKETELAVFQAKLARFIAIKEEAIHRANVQKDKLQTLLSDISHQTKTPISSILLCSQLLKEEPESREKQESLLARLTAQSEKLKFLIEALVNMARLETGAIQCVPKRENIRELLVQVIGDFYEKAQEKDMEISLQCPTKLTAALDRKWMREALGNLVDNSIKYTPSGGRIHIQVTAYELFVQIAVCDNGMGIDEEEIPKTFGRFYRSREVSGAEGLGLGLYLARSMVNAQSGYIRVDSRKGEGSAFRVFLPKDLKK